MMIPEHPLILLKILGRIPQLNLPNIRTFSSSLVVIRLLSQHDLTLRLKQLLI